MRLTDKEMEVMALLWGSTEPMSITEIVRASNNRTWQERSIFSIINRLMDKGVIMTCSIKPTNTRHARTFRPAITAEEYAIKCIVGLKQSGIKIDIDSLVKNLKKLKES